MPRLPARLFTFVVLTTVVGCDDPPGPLPAGGDAELELLRGSLDLGEIDLGAPIPTRWIVRNLGGGPAQIQRVVVGESGELAVIEDTCTGELAPFTQCALTIAVRPALAGPFAAELVIEANTGELVGRVEAVGRARVTVALAGGTGHVTSEPAGIDCGAGATTCSAHFAVPGIVLRASAEATIRWSGDCDGNGDCKLALTGPRAVTAHVFAPLVIIVDESPVRDDLAFGVAIDGANRMLVTGEGAGPLTGLAWTGAFEPGGRQAWVDRFDPGAEGHDAGHALAVAADGSIIVVGQWYSSSWTRWNAFVRKLDAGGRPVWSHQSEEIGDDAYRGVAIDPATGAIYVVGFRPDPGDVVPAPHVRGVIRKLDARGAVEWEQTWPGPADGDAVALDLALDADGNVLVAGRTESAARDTDAWLAAYGPHGDLRWSEQRGGAGDDEAAAIAAAPDGTMVVVGGNAGAGWIARYSAAHGLIAEHRTPEVASWQGVAFTPAGELAVAGGELTQLFTPALEPLWTQRHPALHATDLAVDREGNVVVTGWVLDDIAVIKYFQ